MHTQKLDAAETAQISNTLGVVFSGTKQAKPADLLNLSVQASGSTILVWPLGRTPVTRQLASGKADGLKTTYCYRVQYQCVSARISLSGAGTIMVGLKSLQENLVYQVSRLLCLRRFLRVLALNHMVIYRYTQLSADGNQIECYLNQSSAERTERSTSPAMQGRGASSPQNLKTRWQQVWRPPTPTHFWFLSISWWCPRPPSC